MSMTNSCYDVVTMGGGRLHYLPIDRRIANEAIRLHKLPLLHKVDNRNMIWGDEDFKKAYKKKGVCL